jgi:methionyl-tRNA formyltransferase
MGSPVFAVPALEELVKKYCVAGVITQPDRPSGRGGALSEPAVKTAALSLGIPVLQPEKISRPEALAKLIEWAPSLIVVAAFGQILRQTVLDLPTYGCVNVHGSLLPRWRGAAPIQAAILAGDDETGITIMKMDSGIDTGPILSQRSLPIVPDETSASLFEKMAPLGAELLMETLPGCLKGDLILQPQTEEDATYAPMLKKEDGRLDFTRPAIELERRVRAMNPWPGAFFVWQGKPLKVFRTHIYKENSPGAGQRFIQEGHPAVGTCDGSLVLDEIQPAGKKPRPGKAFLSGVRDWQTN